MRGGTTNYKNLMAEVSSTANLSLGHTCTIMNIICIHMEDFSEMMVMNAIPVLSESESEGENAILVFLE